MIRQQTHFHVALSAMISVVTALAASDAAETEEIPSREILQKLFQADVFESKNVQWVDTPWTLPAGKGTFK